MDCEPKRIEVAHASLDSHEVQVKNTFIEFLDTEPFEPAYMSAPAKVALDLQDPLKSAVERFSRNLSKLQTSNQDNKLQIGDDDRKNMLEFRKEIEKKLKQELRALEPNVTVYITKVRQMPGEERTRLRRGTGSGQDESFTLPSSRDANDTEAELHQKKKEDEEKAKQKEEAEQQKGKQDPSEYLCMKLHTWWTAEEVQLWTGYDQPRFSTENSGLDPAKAEIILQAASLFSPFKLRSDCWMTYKRLGELDDNDAQKFHHINNKLFEMNFDGDESIKFSEVPKTHLQGSQKKQATMPAAPAHVLSLQDLVKSDPGNNLEGPQVAAYYMPCIASQWQEPQQTMANEASSEFLQFRFRFQGGVVERKTLNASEPDEVKQFLKDYFKFEDFGGRKDDPWAWKHEHLPDRFAARNKEELIRCAREAKMNGYDPYELRLERPDGTPV